jgi:hypothetical protein
MAFTTSVVLEGTVLPVFSPFWVTMQLPMSLSSGRHGPTRTAGGNSRGQSTPNVPLVVIYVVHDIGMALKDTS